MKAAPCSRRLAEQAEDQTGARRRGDHDLRRLDLLSDNDLDAYSVRHGSSALDAAEVLAEGLERLAEREHAATTALERKTAARPILAVVVCLACGSFEVVRDSRAWAVDRAMRRSGLAERDVRAAHALLTEAVGARADLDALDADRLRELHGLVGEDVDLDSIRARYSGSRRYVLPNGADEA